MALTQVSRGLLSTSIVDNGNATAITIDANENVGIGTSSPAQALVVSRSSGSTYLDISRATQSQGQVALQLTGGTGGTNWIMYQDTSSDDLRFFGNSSTRMTITSGGNVGIGTSLPSTKLHLGGTAPGDSIIRQDSTASGTNWEIGEREAGKWQIFEDDSDSIVATFMSSGNVGIGTSSPSTFTNYTNFSLKGGSNGSNLDFHNSSGTRIAAFVSNPSTDFIVETTEATPLVFKTNNTERMRILSTGGITFNGDTAQANALDDYEEGTFTPALNGFTGSYIHQIGQYRKVGGLVTAAIHIHVSSTGGSGDIIVTGLPFTQTSSNRYGGATAIHCNSWATTTKPDNALVNPGTTNAAFYKMQGQTGLVTPQLSDMGTGNLLCVFVYMTDQ